MPENDDNVLTSPVARPMPSSDDYDTWEQSVSAEDLRDIRGELQDSSELTMVVISTLLFVLTLDPGFLIPDSEDCSDVKLKEGTEPILGACFITLNLFFGSDPSVEDMELDDEQIPSPSTSQHPARSRLQRRSQTAPEPITGSHSESAPPLRRNQTGPIGHQRSASAHLDALQHAYALIADAGTSQVDVQDLLRARRLANQINQALDEKMCSKIRPN